MDASLHHFLDTVRAQAREQEQPLDVDVISVSETVSVAASAYENLRNTLEYDEEHLLRRNAIRRILQRRLGEQSTSEIATELLRELVWARYLPNKKISERMIGVVQGVLEKYHVLLEAVSDRPRFVKEGQEWLLDALATEVEYVLVSPEVNEALASYAYTELKKRMVWSSQLIKEEDRDLQLFIAVHRAILKSDAATLRYRILSLYYPQWQEASAASGLVSEIADNIETVIQTVEEQINHVASDVMFRLIRKHAIVFHLLQDVAVDNPDAFEEVIRSKDTERLDRALEKAAEAKYANFRTRLQRSVLRAVFFLFITKMMLALIIEWPYEHFILKTTNYVPLLANILFPPFLLGVIGLTVSIPEKKNTQKILQEVHALLGTGEDFGVLFKYKRAWSRGTLAIVFNTLYGAAFAFTVGVIATFLYMVDFNVLSIIFFLFFMSLVMFFGLKIRNSKRELVIVEGGGGFIGTILDILFLPMIRAGRWVAMRAPRVNVFLFFFDFIIEAPFKAAIRMIEGWLAFLREKKEEI